MAHTEEKQWYVFQVRGIPVSKSQFMEALAQQLEGDPLLPDELRVTLKLKKSVAFGLYSHDGKRLCWVRTLGGLYQRLRQFNEEWRSVMVLLAKSAHELPDQFEESIPEDEKRYRNLKQKAYLAIGAAKSRGDEDFLADLRNETRRSGRKLGDKATPEENRRMIEVLRKLSPLCNASPPPIKSLVPDGVPDPTKASRAIHTQIRRFCLRAYQTWKDLNCPPPKWWRDREIKKEFQESCGFEFPRDTIPARDAIERGKKYAERKLKKKS